MPIASLRVDLDVSRRLVKLADKNVTLICESGIGRRQQLEELVALGFKGFLVGTHLIKSGQPGPALAELLGA